MTKSELIDRLAAQFPQLVAKDAELAVKMILDAMAESLAKGERIEIRGFGSFGLNYRPPRTGRNPKSGEKVQVPQKHVPHFKAGKELRERVDFGKGERTDGSAGMREGARLMQIVRWIVGVVVFLALLFLSLQNAELVRLRFFNLVTFEAPLIFVVLIAFALGRGRGPARRRGQGGATQGPAQPAAPRASPRRASRRRRTAPRRGRRRRRARASSGHDDPHATRSLPMGKSWAARRLAVDFELWWLLPIVAVFFALGWIAARIDIKHLMRESRALPLSYFRGLNFLLNEQPDKAIESFIEVVKVDPQTIDLHFALGSLFRRQGEVERAIRMHQNLLDRPDLPADKRTTATFELAQDFHRAGMLDRAEELFTKLDGSPFEHASLGHLISIYETEKDWPKAIAATRRMEELAKQPYYKEIAQYHCELAQAALLRNDAATAASEIEQALAAHRACARANLIAGDLARAAGRPRRRGRDVAAHRDAESGVPRARGGALRRRVPQARRPRDRHPRSCATTRRSIRRSTS